MYYYGARYYDPRISIFVSVDPLAEKYPGWTPYHYVHNNPINMVDPTGMEADGWRKNLANGEMSYDDSYTFENTPEGYEYSDAGMDDKYYYNPDGTKGMTDDYMYDIAFGPSKPKSQPISTLSRGHGNADISKLQGNVVDALKYDLPEGLQNVGDGMAAVGYGLTLTGVGAKIGVPLAGAGNAISGVGSGIEIGVNLFSGNLGKSGQGFGFMVGGELLNAGLNKVIPGPKTDLGKQILKQNVGLKLKGAEYYMNNKEN